MTSWRDDLNEMVQQGKWKMERCEFYDTHQMVVVEDDGISLPKIRCVRCDKIDFADQAGGYGV